ncbi:macrolide family glycosyltransferase [Streptomyces sp. NPDC049970]|uniref:macrolide family glycosyltransferase n=1 Tax=Streptomyces sp. NPDC049970 TaxID=3155033 RepID=UPI00344774C1
MNGRPEQDAAREPRPRHGPEHEGERPYAPPHDRGGRAGHIGVFTFPAYAHIAPAVPMLAELVRRGHRVTCFVADRFADLVREAGAEAVVYPSEFPWSDGATGSVLDGILDFFAESIAPLETAVARFRDDPPDLLAHDLAASEAARLLARAWDVPVVQLCPTIASSPGFSMSECQAREVTGPPPGPVDPENPAITDFVARKRRLLTGLGIDGAPLDGFGAEDGANIVFLPKAFQVAPETFDDRFAFIGPCLAEAPAKDEGWQPPEGREVLLLSLGSSYTPDQADFLRSCVQALADSPWHVVVTLGHRVTPDELGPLPDNVEAHRWLRHPEVLRHACAFITHAGMGSVMESLSYGVPMVLVPYHIDQRVIARQAADLMLGRVLLREGDTGAEALRAAVGDVTTSPGVSAAVAEMRRQVREAGGAARGADAVESLMRLPGTPTRPRTHEAPPTEVTHP